MGFNTVVMFLNDNLYECSENAQEVMDAIRARASGGIDDERADRCSPDLRMPYQIKIPTVHHADDTVLIAAGGNYCTKLLHTFGSSHHTRENQVRLLEEWADKLGYRISKKRSNRKYDI